MEQALIQELVDKEFKPESKQGWTVIGCSPKTKKEFLAIQKEYKLKSTNATLRFLIGVFLKCA